jgi:putative transposase
MILTYRYRIKDATTAKHLSALAERVNTLWNRCRHEQAIVTNHYDPNGPNLRWPSHYDLVRHFTGHAHDCDLHSDTINRVAATFVQSRDTHKKNPKRRGRKSLGWVPFIPRAAKVENDTVTYMKQAYRFWRSRPVGGKIKTGGFVADARGRWYVTFQCEVATAQTTNTSKIGLDLGCIDLATGTDGRKIVNPRWFAKHENALAVAQRVRNKKRVKAIHAKIVNCRKHHLHVESTKLVQEFGRIVVGDVNAKQLAQTRMAKSVLDASWSAFRGMLRYKCQKAGVRYEEASERYSTRACSACGSLSGPKGVSALGIRQWVFCDCGADHDRDVNAALNILAGAERRPPVVEIPAL